MRMGGVELLFSICRVYSMIIMKKKKIEDILDLYYLSLCLKIKLPRGFFSLYLDDIEKVGRDETKIRNIEIIEQIYQASTVSINDVSIDGGNEKKRNTVVDGIIVDEMKGMPLKLSNVILTGFSTAVTVQEGSSVTLSDGGAIDVNCYLKVNSNPGEGNMSDKTNIEVKRNEFDGDITTFFKGGKGPVSLVVEDNKFKGKIETFIDNFSQEEKDVLDKMYQAPQEFIEEYVETMKVTPAEDRVKKVSDLKILKYLNAFEKFGDVGLKLADIWDKIKDNF